MKQTLFSNHHSRQWWLRMTQIAVSLALIGWLLTHISWREVLDLMIQANVWLILVACSLYYFGVALSCLKWSIALRVETLRVPFANLFRWYLIGAFMSNFLPTDVGGDLGRGFYASRFTAHTGAVVRSIVVERLTGLIAMLVLGALGVVMVAQQTPIELIGGVTGLALLVLVVVFIRRTRALKHPWLTTVIQKLMDSWTRYRNHPMDLFVLSILSFAFQILAGIGVWLNLSAVGVNLPLPTIVLATALIGTAGLLPISVNGWGVREALVVGLLAPLGALPDRLLAGALLGRILYLIVTLAGGVLLLFEQHPLRVLQEKDPSA